jgi:rhomboid protease GluP
LLVLGNIRFAAGDFAGASSDLARSIGLDRDANAMLRRYLARSRLGEAAAAETELATNASSLKTKEWPLPLIELYLGTRSPAATLDATSNPFDRCETQYLIGEWHVLKGHTADAEAALNGALETCPKHLRVHTYALAELKRL